MREIVKSPQFMRDLKKVKKAGKYSLIEIETALGLLVTDASLPESYRDHALKGQWKKFQARDCHIAPDLVLVYSKPPGLLRLFRIASHSELF